MSETPRRSYRDEAIIVGAMLLLLGVVCNEFLLEGLLDSTRGFDLAEPRSAVWNDQRRWPGYERHGIELGSIGFSKEVNGARSIIIPQIDIEVRHTWRISSIANGGNILMAGDQNATARKRLGAAIEKGGVLKTGRANAWIQVLHGGATNKILWPSQGSGCAGTGTE